MGKQYDGVRPGSGSTIEIDFYYAGRRCRERVQLEPSPANLRRAANHRAAVLDAIARGTFDYAATFPGSKNAAQFGKKRTSLTVQQAAIERGMQAEKDRADADYRGAILARQAADRLVADQRKRIDGLLDQLRRRSEAARAGSRPDEPGEDWIGIFGQCVAEYERMGAEAGRLADKVNGLQGYVRAIRRAP